MLLKRKWFCKMSLFLFVCLFQLAIKKKVQEFYENEKNLNFKTKLELEDLCKQEAFRDNCRYEELKAQQKQL